MHHWWEELYKNEGPFRAVKYNIYPTMCDPLGLSISLMNHNVFEKPV